MDKYICTPVTVLQKTTRFEYIFGSSGINQHRNFKAYKCYKKATLKSEKTFSRRKNAEKKRIIFARHIMKLIASKTRRVFTLTFHRKKEEENYFLTRVGFLRKDHINLNGCRNFSNFLQQKLQLFQINKSTATEFQQVKIRGI